jgi:uncharacterized damage-inducible protein DinB
VRELLLEGLEYERWANGRWFEVLARLESRTMFDRMTRGLLTNGSGPHEADAFETMRHILWAQGVWLRRCGGDLEPLEALPSDERVQAFREAARALHVAWWDMVGRRDLGEIVEYGNLRGEPHARRFSDIVRHLMNHGTYHRGQLRQIVEELGVGDFPDTDFIHYVAARDAGKLPD